MKILIRNKKHDFVLTQFINLCWTSTEMNDNDAKYDADRRVKNETPNHIVGVTNILFHGCIHCRSLSLEWMKICFGIFPPSHFFFAKHSPRRRKHVIFSMFAKLCISGLVRSLQSSVSKMPISFK